MSLSNINNKRFAASIAAFAIVAVTIASNVIMPMYALAANASTVSTSPTQKAQVSFTFDDGLQSISTLAVPTLAKYGLTGTSYVISSCVGMVTVPNTCRADTTKPYMTWAQISAAAAAGWEIGSHTVTHPLLTSTDPTDQPTKLTTAQVIAELTDSKNAIFNNTGITPTAFASPYGDYEPSGNPVLSEIAKLYTSHRGFADAGYNVTPYAGGTLPVDDYPLNNYLLRDQQIQTTSNTGTAQPANVTVAKAQAMIDKAIADKAWVVLTFHDIVAGAVTPATDDYDYSNANLDAIAAYVKTKQDAGLITSTNVTNGLPKPGTAAPVLNEIFNTGIANGWTTDSPTNFKADAAGNGDLPDSTNSISITGSKDMTHLFSPKVAVDPTQTYVISCFINITSLIGEIGLYMDEYDAAGNAIAQVAGTTGGGYKISVNAGTNPHVAEVSFTYKPTTTAFMAALQIIAVSNATQTYQAYLDNVKMYSVTAPGLGAGKAGDVNGDGNVDALDLSTLLINWKKTAQTRTGGDLNGDTVVDALDLSTLLINWRK